jgi:hypothetical protein
LLWIAGATAAGYGQVNGYYAHRLSYQCRYGPIPDNKPIVRHKCDTPSCVNPDHLIAGTTLDNNRDMHARGRAFRLRGELLSVSKLTDKSVMEIRQAMRAGAKSTELAKKFSVTHQAIAEVYTGETWKHVGGPIGHVGYRQGERVYNSVLTSEKVIEIRRRFQMGETDKSIATFFGMKKSTIQAARTGRNWSHVK